MPNKRGESIFMFLIMSLCVSAMGLFQMVKVLEVHKDIRNRKNTYLCTGQFIKANKTYLGFMKKMNKYIRYTYTAYKAASATKPEVAAALRLIWLAEKKTQQIYHFAHIKNIATLKYCSTIQKVQLVMKLPFKNKASILTRDITGVTKLRRKKWDILIKSKKFYIELSYKMKSSLSNHSLKAKEKIRVAGLSQRLLHSPF